MNPNLPSREQIELRITALLLGELPAEEAALLRYTIEKDAELQKLYDAIASTLPLVREAEKDPAGPPVETSAPLKLSNDRRQKLLEHFKTPRATAPRDPLFWLKRINAPRLVPVLLLVGFIALVAAVLLPALSPAKYRSKFQRGQYGTQSSELAYRTWAADNSERKPMETVSGSAKVTSAEPPAQVVTVAPAPVMAAPPASREHVQIALPQPNTEGGVQFGVPMTAGTTFNPPNNATFGTADLPPVIPPGSIPLPAGSMAFTDKKDQSSLNDSGKWWIVPSQATDSIGSVSAGSGGGGGGAERSQGPGIVHNEEDVFATMSRQPFAEQPKFEPPPGVMQPASAGTRPTADQIASANLSKDSAALPTGKFPDSGVVGIIGRPAAVQKTEAPPLSLAQNTVNGTATLPPAAESPAQPRASSTTDSLNYQLNLGGLADRHLRTKNEPSYKTAVGDSTMAIVTSPPATGASEFVPSSTGPTTTSIAYEDAKRDLQKELDLHKLLYSKLEAEKIDLSLPKNSMVEITDPAEPMTKQTLWQRLTGRFASTARIKVENDVTDIQGMSGKPNYMPYDPYFIQTTFEVMQSEAVLGKVVDALHLQTAWAKENGGQKLPKARAIQLLKQRLDFQPVENTKLVSISATDSNPKEAADIANAVARAYREYRMDRRDQLMTNGVAILEQQFAQQAKEIQVAQAKVTQLGQQLRAHETEAQADRPIRKPAPNAPIPQPEILTCNNAFSTFAMNVSDVSFKFAEASLLNGRMPDAASIRSEEFINAFDYRDPEAAPGQRMAFTAERAHYPFAHNRDLLRLSIKAAAEGRQAGRALNLVILLDNSGSMERSDRVNIIHEALRVLATQLQPQDTVSVVTFSRTARLWADGVSGDKAGETLKRVGGITPEGGTNLEEAMRLAYETARRHYLANGMNRVVLLTDGAANLGNVDPETLKHMVDTQRKQGIDLDCFGVGWEDYNDDLLELLSSNGGGRYAFLNSPEDAAREFAAKLAGALKIAAADLKVQVEFNPERVTAYRQIGYARHQLTKEQFRDNSVAAGEIAAREAGNALYVVEVNPDGQGAIATVRVRYRVPGTTDYREQSWLVPYTGSAPALDQSSPAMRLAAAASAFSEWLAASPYAQEVTLDQLLKTLSGVPEIYGADHRPRELQTMIEEAKSLQVN